MVLFDGESQEESNKLIPEFDSFGIIPKKSKTTNCAVILRLTHDLSVIEKPNFASLFLENLQLDCPSVPHWDVIGTLS